MSASSQLKGARDQPAARPADRSGSRPPGRANVSVRRRVRRAHQDRQPDRPRARPWLVPHQLHRRGEPERLYERGREPVTERTRGVIAAYVRAHPGASPAVIAEGAGLSRELVKKSLQRMAASGELRADGRGHYFAGGRRHVSPVTPRGDNGDTGKATATVPANDRGAASPAVVAGDDAAPAVRWPCACCGWRQMQSGADRCEACGWPRSREGS